MKQTKELTVKSEKFKNFLEKPNVRNMITKTLPKFLNPETFFRSIFLSAYKNPKIYECSPESIIASILQCAELGLMPILNRAHLVPYWNSKKKCYECQFQPGYLGMSDLVRRSGEIQDVAAHVVYTNDKFSLDYMNPEKSFHQPCFGDRGEPIGAYALWTKKDGSKTIGFLTMDEIYKRREKSVAWQAGQKDSNKQDSPWHQWPEEQYKKTVIKNSSKLQPCSIEMQIAIDYDNNAEIGEENLLSFDLPEIEPPQKALSFEAQIPKDIDKNLIDAFLLKCSDDNPDMSIDDIKENAADNIEYFLTALKAFEEKKVKESKPAAKKTTRKKTPIENKAILEPEIITPAKDADIYNKLRADQKMFPVTFIDIAEKRKFNPDINKLTKEQAKEFHIAINAEIDKT